MSNLLKKSIVLFIPILMCSTLLACTPNHNVTGMIISLDDAYARKLIDANDLQNIAYYMGCAGDTDFTPKPKNPEALSDTTIQAIKRLYLQDLQNEIHEASINDVSIDAYYGVYSNRIAVRLSNKSVRCDYIFDDEKVIGGVTFYNYCEAFVSIVVIDEIGH